MATTQISVHASRARLKAAAVSMQDMLDVGRQTRDQKIPSHF
jgi:hypothetical protein